MILIPAFDLVVHIREKALACLVGVAKDGERGAAAFDLFVNGNVRLPRCADGHVAFQYITEVCLSLQCNP